MVTLRMVLLKKKFYSAGGRKADDVEAREALFQKFVEMRSSLRAQLLKNLSFAN